MANEKRLIDANIVRNKINAFAASVVYRGSNLMITGKDSCNPEEYTRGYEKGVLDATNIVTGEQTVDAVEVVRCKDCKHWYEETLSCMCGNHYDDNWYGEDFCSYGERITDD